MRVVFAKHAPYETGHLGEVVAEMVQVGPPTLRVMEWDGHLCALEGSHRLAAAHYLGEVPKLVIECPDVPDYRERSLDGLPMYTFESALVLDLRDFA
jgi:hypothetical protein